VCEEGLAAFDINYDQEAEARRARRLKIPSTPDHGTFRFPKMPFGLCKAPATFQRLMDTVLSGLNYEICLAYLDDIIVFSRDLETHLQRLEQLFKRIREANLKLKPSKCSMLQKRVTFLGYTFL